MKEILAAAFLACTSSVFACTYTTVDAPNLREIRRQKGGYPITAAQCEFLERNELGILINGQAGVLGNTSVAWVAVRLISPKFHVVSNETQEATRLNTQYASQDYADHMLYQALDIAINNLDFVKAAQQVAAALAERR